MWSRRREAKHAPMWHLMHEYKKSNLRTSVGRVVGVKGGEIAPKKDGIWKITRWERDFGDQQTGFERTGQIL